MTDGPSFQDECELAESQLRDALSYDDLDDPAMRALMMQINRWQDKHDKRPSEVVAALVEAQRRKSPNSI